jgi:Protein of unknown function (DUF3295)
LNNQRCRQVQLRLLCSVPQGVHHPEFWNRLPRRLVPTGALDLTGEEARPLADHFLCYDAICCLAIDIKTRRALTGWRPTVASFPSFYAYRPSMLPETLQNKASGVANDTNGIFSKPTQCEPHTYACNQHSESRIHAKRAGECIPEVERKFEYKRGEDKVSPYLSEDGSFRNGSENAIEDEDDSSQWTDSKTESDGSSSSDDQLFKRVMSSANIPRQRSFLTTELNKIQREDALARNASNFQRLQQPRTSLPNSLFITESPEGGQESAVLLTGLDIPRSTPVDITTSNSHAVADSPRKVRKNMLEAEMTSFLRANLLREHQDKRATVNAVLKRKGSPKISSSRHSFDHERDYYEIGW